VLGGLADGDLIVIEGIVKLRDGARMRYDDKDAAVSETAPVEPVVTASDARG
jgi:hypothetical protein